ncbi:MAG: CoA pyrophosphatase [Mycobacteriales bacterium]
MNVSVRESISIALASFDRVPVAVADRRAAAVALALVEDDAGPGVLLTRRAAGLRAHAGQWALPGGRIDAGETASDAARREMEEELGVRTTASDVLGVLDDYPTRSGYVITPVVLWVGPVGVLRPNPDEVASAHVVALSALDVEPRFVTIPESAAPVIQLPLFGRYVHAPTAAVLYQFREVALHRRTTRVAHYEQPVFAWR